MSEQKIQQLLQENSDLDIRLEEIETELLTSEDIYPLTAEQDTLISKIIGNSREYRKLRYGSVR
jgi:hypothetical protein